MRLRHPVGTALLGAFSIIATLTFSLSTSASAAPAVRYSPAMFKVQASLANAGGIAVVNNTDTKTYGTCAAPANPGTSTCVIRVPDKTGYLVVAQPAAGARLQTWHAHCTKAPGDVCHLWGVGRPDAVAVLAPARSGPAITTSIASLQGGATACAPNTATTVTGTGFPADSPATLSDDGTVVATGTTDANGSLTLPYTATGSDPGIYRILSVSAGGASASNDVNNNDLYCWSFTPGQSSATVTVNYSGMDANVDNPGFGGLSFNFGHTRIALVTNAQGAGSVTKTYSCIKGTSVPTYVQGSRGKGEPGTFNYWFQTNRRYRCR